MRSRSVYLSIPLLLVACPRATEHRSETREPGEGRGSRKDATARRAPFPGPCSAAGTAYGTILEREYSYDDGGRLIAATTHWTDRGSDTSVDQRFTERWTYDDLGRPILHELAPIPDRPPDDWVTWTCAQIDDPEAERGWERWTWPSSGDHFERYEATGIGFWIEQGCLPNRWVELRAESRERITYFVYGIMPEEVREAPETLEPNFAAVARRDGLVWAFTRATPTTWRLEDFWGYEMTTGIDGVAKFRIDDGRVSFLARDESRGATGVAPLVEWAGKRRWTWEHTAEGLPRSERSTFPDMEPVTWVYDYDDEGHLRRISGEAELEWDGAGNLIRAEEIELDYSCWSDDAPVARPSTDVEYFAALVPNHPLLPWMSRDSWTPVVAPGIWTTGLGPLGWYDAEGPLRPYTGY